LDVPRDENKWREKIRTKMDWIWSKEIRAKGDSFNGTQLNRTPWTINETFRKWEGSTATLRLQVKVGKEGGSGNGDGRMGFQESYLDWGETQSERGQKSKSSHYGPVKWPSGGGALLEATPNRGFYDR